MAPLLARQVSARWTGYFTDWLDDIGGEWWFLLVILGIAFFDSLIPVVPSETLSSSAASPPDRGTRCCRW